MSVSTQSFNPTTRSLVLQGTVSLSEYGKGEYRAIGNTATLKLSPNQTVFEIKEHSSGKKSVEKLIENEMSVKLSMMLQNISPRNLALALQAEMKTIAAGTITDESIVCTVGIKTGGIGLTKRTDVSALTLKQGSTSLTAYTNATTPWDFDYSSDGAIRLNDGSVLAVDKLGTAITGITVGATTTITVANTAAVGDKVSLRGFTGADASFLNGTTVTITARTDADITFAVDTTTKTITAGVSAKAIFLDSNGDIKPITVLASYSHAAKTKIAPLTLGLKEYALRFLGINTDPTSRGSFAGTIHKISFSPTKEIDWLSDKPMDITLDGNVLYDASVQAVEGDIFSNYFTFEM